MAVKLSRRSAIDPFIVMDMMRAAATQEADGADIVHMEIGQPGTKAPQGVLAAARRALTDDRLGYCAALGLPDLRRRIAGHYQDAYGVSVDAERVIVTSGASAGFLLAVLAVFDQGDRVALSMPGYPAYRNMLGALGVEAVPVVATATDRFQMRADRVAEIAGPLHGLVVTSPNNPTGTMIDAEGLAQLHAVCEARNLCLISDEIYHGIEFDRAPVTAAQFERAIVVNSFSKYFSMTGWRIGWLVVPEHLVRPIERLLQNLFIATTTLSQIAAVAAFDCHEELVANVAVYGRNRALLLDRLPDAGFGRIAPVDGGFYLYADVGQMTNDSAAFCHAMLAEAGVAATPGLDFDPINGHRFVRFCFAGTHADTEAACARLGDWHRRPNRF